MVSAMALAIAALVLTAFVPFAACPSLHYDDWPCEPGSSCYCFIGRPAVLEFTEAVTPGALASSTPGYPCDALHGRRGPRGHGHRAPTGPRVAAGSTAAANSSDPAAVTESVTAAANAATSRFATAANFVDRAATASLHIGG